MAWKWKVCLLCGVIWVKVRTNWTKWKKWQTWWIRIQPRGVRRQAVAPVSPVDKCSGPLILKNWCPVQHSTGPLKEQGADQGKTRDVTLNNHNCSNYIFDYAGYVVLWMASSGCWLVGTTEVEKDWIVMKFGILITLLTAMRSKFWFVQQTKSPRRHAHDSHIVDNSWLICTARMKLPNLSLWLWL